MKFEEFGLKPEILEAVKESGFTEPTPVQEECIPLIMQDKDVIAQSKTGSGKTAAFALPILNSISSMGKVQAMILTPTRELCVQVADAFMQFGKGTPFSILKVFGGVDIEPQISGLRKADVVIGTPGRILDHISRGTINFSNIRFMVLDEVDRMADMGFIDDVEKIMRKVPGQRQTLVFSATVTRDVNRLAARHMKNPVTVKAEQYVEDHLLNQAYYNVSLKDKFSLLVYLLKHSRPGLKLIFCATRREVDIISRNLQLNNINALAIHGGLTQTSRMKALDSLKESKIDVLVATDVAARGLDIKNVTAVYNYDVPKKAIEYVHRIGRTARAGEAGNAITILCEPDYDSFRRILRDTRFDIKRMQTPKFSKIKFVTGFRKTEDHLSFGKPARRKPWKKPYRKR